jgi:hypothetical protein
VVWVVDHVGGAQAHRAGKDRITPEIAPVTVLPEHGVRDSVEHHAQPLLREAQFAVQAGVIDGQGRTPGEFFREEQVVCRVPTRGLHEAKGDGAEQVSTCDEGQAYIGLRS